VHGRMERDAPCSRARLAMRPGCLPGEAGSIPVESVISP